MSCTNDGSNLYVDQGSLMSFSKFNFHDSIANSISAYGFTHPTPIQKETIPKILNGQDLFGLAQTGTGKTAAFVLPIIQRLLTGERNKPRALIIAPTRELAEQIHTNIKGLARHTGLKSTVLYGGVSKLPQIRSMRAGSEIIVACPGRLLDLYNCGNIKFDHLEILVLDEADHMFDHGFLPDIKRIVKLLPVKRQTLVFSATMPSQIKTLAEQILNKPVTVRVNPSLPAPTISHALFHISKNDRTNLLKKLFNEKRMESTLVFTRTKHKAKTLALQLSKAGFRAASLQGNLSQNKRQEALEGFRDGVFKILVATDIAARGIDVLGISHVINYDLPDTVETYTHRTGRTGRADQKGRAYSFVSVEDRGKIALIEKKMGKKIRQMPSPLGNSEKIAKKPKNKKAIIRHETKQQRFIWSESLSLA